MRKTNGVVRKARILSMSAMRRKWLLAIALILLILAASSPVWLPWPGLLLVNSAQPGKADAILVLAGDYYGYRAQAGAELARQGVAPRAMISGSDWYYGLWECDLAIEFAVKNGQPRDILEPFRNQATSTEAELAEFFALAQQRNWRRIVIVTSNFHTRRTGLLVNRLKPPDMVVDVFAAPHRYFQPEQWWWHRESRKILFLEWTKLLAMLMGGL